MMIVGIVISLAGLIMLYLAVTDVPLGTVAKQVAQGQAVQVPKKVAK